MPVIPELQMGRRTLSSAQKYVQVPFVLACLDGLLGSPVPMVLLAKTRNSYSTQGLNSVTVALSWWPATTSGTDMKHNATFSAQKVKYVSIIQVHMADRTPDRLDISPLI